MYLIFEIPSLNDGVVICSHLNMERSNDPVLKMEFITVLKNSEAHVNIGDNVVNDRPWNLRICRRLRDRITGHTLMIAILTMLILILFITQLPLYHQVQIQTHKLEVIQKKIDRLTKITKELGVNGRTRHYGSATVINYLCMMQSQI